MVWWAAGELLAAQEAPGFAAALLQQSEFVLLIEVDARRVIICNGHRRLGGPPEERRRLPGMPPVPVYNFAVNCNGRANRITESIGWSRETSLDGYEYRSSEHDWGSVMCQLWLEQLVGREFGQLTVYRDVEFTDAADYIAAVQTAWRELVECQRKVVRAMVACKMITGDEASGWSPSTKVLVVDYRSGAHPALPVAPDVPAPFVRGK
jgi:hypothetical protein